MLELFNVWFLAEDSRKDLAEIRDRRSLASPPVATTGTRGLDTYVRRFCFVYFIFFLVLIGWRQID